MQNPNRDLLIQAARLLKPLLGELVFVGGCTTGLLITDDAAADVRPTYDVDAITAVSSYADYVEFSERLRRLGFTEDSSEGAPICRWRQGPVILDIMPLDEQILGFANRWYRPAIESPEEHELEPKLTIRAVNAVYFCATKLEAFAGRGKSDFFASRDLEDLIALVDGRPELRNEIASAEVTVRRHISSSFQALLDEPRFIDSLPGYLLPDVASQARILTLIARLQGISSIGQGILE